MGEGRLSAAWDALWHAWLLATIGGWPVEMWPWVRWLSAVTLLAVMVTNERLVWWQRRLIEEMERRDAVRTGRTSDVE